MGRIQVLDQITIDKIAAGEVIERPASVVKELVENAIDAGSSSVTVEIKDGGISFMRIADNGCGIPKDEVAQAFLRHSTSKIRSVDDLAHITSLGFRGEALSSIAAVSQVELITKTKEDTFGTNYQIAGGREEGIGETGAPDGTTFLIRQLFYNVPARKKFLKTAMTEAGHVSDLMTRLALSHPEISFRFINNGQPKLHTSGNGNVRDVIYHVYGRDIAANLLAADYDRDGIRISGFLGAPLISRGNRNFENYFINGRYIRSNIIYKAIEDAYKDFSMQHRFPFAVLHISLSGEGVDVNVHPTKMEVRFGNQQGLYNAVYEAVSGSLHGRELIPQVTVDVPENTPAHRENRAASARAGSSRMGTAPEAEMPLRTETSPETGMPPQAEAAPEKKKLPPRTGTAPEAGMPLRTETAPEAGMPPRTETTPEKKKLPPREERDLDYFMEEMRKRVKAYHDRSSSAEVKSRTEVFRPERQADRIREAVTYAAKPQKQAEQLNLFEEHFLDRQIKAEYTLIGQVFGTYWLVQYHDNLYIIDQHAAHERVLYEKTLKGMQTREFTSQMISPPIILNLTMQERELLERYMDRFTRIGFEFEEFGQESYAVRAVPDNLFSIAKKELLMDMIDSLSDEVNRSLSPDLIDEKIASMSCKAAVKGNMHLSAAEVGALIGELLTLDNPYHCPHGRPTIITMSKRELEKKFKRIV